MIFHVNSVHRDWLFYCDVCGQGFLTKYNMIIHVNTVHEVCHFTVMFVESCFMNFTDLKLHMDACREDSTSCRFSCDVCGEGLFTKDNMIIHVNTVHKAWRFWCDGCWKLFMNFSNLNMHVDLWRQNVLFLLVLKRQITNTS